MKEAKKIKVGINVKFDKSSNLYHAIGGFINMKQGEDEPNDAFKLCFHKVYNIMDIAAGGNTL